MFLVLCLCFIWTPQLFCDARPNLSSGHHAERATSKRIELPLSLKLQDVQATLSKASRQASEDARQHLAAMKRKHMDFIRQNFFQSLAPLPHIRDRLKALGPHWKHQPLLSPCVKCFNHLKNTPGIFMRLPPPGSSVESNPCHRNILNCLHALESPNLRPVEVTTAKNRPCPGPKCNQKPPLSTPFSFSRPNLNQHRQQNCSLNNHPFNIHRHHKCKHYPYVPENLRPTTAVTTKLPVLNEVTEKAKLTTTTIQDKTTEDALYPGYKPTQYSTVPEPVNTESSKNNSLNTNERKPSDNVSSTSTILEIELPLPTPKVPNPTFKPVTANIYKIEPSTSDTETTTEQKESATIERIKLETATYSPVTKDITTDTNEATTDSLDMVTKIGLELLPFATTSTMSDNLENSPRNTTDSEKLETTTDLGIAYTTTFTNKEDSNLPKSSPTVIIDAPTTTYSQEEFKISVITELTTAEPIPHSATEQLHSDPSLNGNIYDRFNNLLKPVEDSSTKDDFVTSTTPDYQPTDVLNHDSTEVYEKIIPETTTQSSLETSSEEQLYSNPSSNVNIYDRFNNLLKPVEDSSTKDDFVTSTTPDYQPTDVLNHDSTEVYEKIVPETTTQSSLETSSEEQLYSNPSSNVNIYDRFNNLVQPVEDSKTNDNFVTSTIPDLPSINVLNRDSTEGYEKINPDTTTQRYPETSSDRSHADSSTDEYLYSFQHLTTHSSTNENYLTTNKGSGIDFTTDNPGSTYNRAPVENSNVDASTQKLQSEEEYLSYSSDPKLLHSNTKVTNREGIEVDRATSENSYIGETTEGFNHDETLLTLSPMVRKEDTTDVEGYTTEYSQEATVKILNVDVTTETYEKESYTSYNGRLSTNTPVIGRGYTDYTTGSPNSDPPTTVPPEKLNIFDHQRENIQSVTTLSDKVEKESNDDAIFTTSTDDSKKEENISEYAHENLIEEPTTQRHFHAYDRSVENEFYKTTESIFSTLAQIVASEKVNYPKNSDYPTTEEYILRNEKDARKYYAEEHHLDDISETMGDVESTTHIAAATNENITDLRQELIQLELESETEKELGNTFQSTTVKEEYPVTEVFSEENMHAKSETITQQTHVTDSQNPAGFAMSQDDFIKFARSEISQIGETPTTEIYAKESQTEDISRPTHDIPSITTKTESYQYRTDNYKEMSTFIQNVYEETKQENMYSVLATDEMEENNIETTTPNNSGYEISSGESTRSPQIIDGSLNSDSSENVIEVSTYEPDKMFRAEPNEVAQTIDFEVTSRGRIAENYIEDENSIQPTEKALQTVEYDTFDSNLSNDLTTSNYQDGSSDDLAAKKQFEEATTITDQLTSTYVPEITTVKRDDGFPESNTVLVSEVSTQINVDSDVPAEEYLYDVRSSDGNENEDRTYQSGVVKYTTEIEENPNADMTLSLSKKRSLARNTGDQDLHASVFRVKRSTQDNKKGTVSKSPKPSVNQTSNINFIRDKQKDSANLSPNSYASTILELLPVIREGYKNNAFSEDDKVIIRSIFGDIRAYINEETLTSIKESNSDLLMKDGASRMEDMVGDTEYEYSEYDQPEIGLRMRRSKKNVQRLNSILDQLSGDLKLKTSRPTTRTRKIRSSGPSPISDAAAILALLAEKGDIQLDRPDDDEDEDDYEYFEEEEYYEDEAEDSSDESSNIYDDRYDDEASFLELIVLAKKHNQRKAREDSS